MWRIALATLIFLGPSMAAAGSPVPIDVYAEVDHALRPATVLADPEAYRGRTVLVGGVVERTVSEAGGVTLEISCWQLDREDRPESPDASQGRVVAGSANLDGAKLQPGRLVTLVGVVAGNVATPAGNLPHLVIRFVHPWPTAAEEAAAWEAPCSRGCGCDRWCDPWWYDPWYYGPYPRWRFGAGYYRHWH
jgi:outer membrane lipoprotein